MSCRPVLSRSCFISLLVVAGACTDSGQLGPGPGPGPEEGPVGDRVFDETLVHSVELAMDQADWQTILDLAAEYENVNADFPYAPAAMVFDGVPMAGDVGVRLKGHISIPLTEGNSYPLKVDFNRYTESQTLDGLTKLNLNTNFNGPALPIMREFLSYDAWNDYGIAASRTSFAQVTMNDEELGVYLLLEQVDGGFIQRSFDPPHGQLYKPEQQSGNLEYRGPNIEDYPDINHKWPDEPDHGPVLHAIDVLNHGSPSDLEEVFDPEGVLTYLAGNVALSSWDSYPATGHNYYLYEATPGRFTLLPWDMNGSLESVDSLLCAPYQGLLSRRLLQTPANEERYLEIVHELLETSASDESLLARLDVAEELVGSEFAEHEFENLRSDIQIRSQLLEEHLSQTMNCEAPPPE